MTFFYRKRFGVMRVVIVFFLLITFSTHLYEVKLITTVKLVKREKRRDEEKKKKRRRSCSCILYTAFEIYVPLNPSSSVDLHRATVLWTDRWSERLPARKTRHRIAQDRFEWIPFWLVFYYWLFVNAIARNSGNANVSHCLDYIAIFFNGFVYLMSSRFYTNDIKRGIWVYSDILVRLFSNNFNFLYLRENTKVVKINCSLDGNGNIEVSSQRHSFFNGSL